MNAPRPEMKVSSVVEDPVEVVCPAHRIEVVLLVVVERRLLAQAPVRWGRGRRRCRRPTDPSRRHLRSSSAPPSTRVDPGRSAIPHRLCSR